MYDVVIFHTLLKYVYGIVELKEAEGKSADDYIKKLTPLYNLSFLDEKKKSIKVSTNMRRIDADVFFFQEYSTNFEELIRKSG